MFRSALVALLVIGSIGGLLPIDDGAPAADAARRRSRLVRPGKALPTGDTCAESVPSRPEIRPDNEDENSYIPVKEQDYNLIPWTLDTFGIDDEADAFRQRIDGNFAGTTDEILLWGACKWGFKHNVVRAMAVAESAWRMSKVGDLDKGTPSYGILQVKAAFHPGTAPASQKSTAFNVDYALGYIRACYEGYIDWLGRQFDSYGPGDIWGCVGHWFSGGWHDEGATNYVGDVRGHARLKIWRRADFDNWT